MNPFPFQHGGFGLGGTQVAAAGDTNWASRLALPDFDGVDGSTVIADHKGLVSWTTSGTAQLDTAQSRISGSSLLLGGGVSDWVAAADSAPWAFGTNDFQIEFSVRPSTLTGNHIILSQWGSATGDRAFIIYLTSTGQLVFSVHTTAGSAVSASAGGFASVGGWADGMAGRSGNTIYVWSNGTRSGTTGNISTNGVANPTSAVRIGADSNGNTRYAGHVDQLRVSLLSPPSGNYAVSLPFPTGP